VVTLPDPCDRDELLRGLEEINANLRANGVSPLVSRAAADVMSDEDIRMALNGSAAHLAHVVQILGEAE
jgi:cytochrome c553